MRVSHFETVPISQKYFRNTPLNVADSDSMRIDTNENRVKAAHQVDRYAVIGDSSFDVGSIRLSGSEVDVTGRSMRLLAVTPDHHIRSQTWVSRDGLVRCRYYNWVTGTYEWEESIKQVDERGLLSVGTVTCGGQQMRMRPERAIAIAWVNIPGHLIHEPACAVLINPSDSICASNVGWLSRRHVRLPRRWHTSCIPPPMSESNSDDEGVGDGNASEELHTALDSTTDNAQSESAQSDCMHSDDEDQLDEVWKPIEYMQRTASTQVRRFCRNEHGNVFVSTRGRIRNDIGMLPTCMGEGGQVRVDAGVFGQIPVADAVAQTFGCSRGVFGRSVDGCCDATAVRLVQLQSPPLRPAEKHVYDCFLQGEDVRDIARARGSAVGTVCCHIERALTCIEFADVPSSVWKRLIPRSVMRAFETMYRDKEEVLSGKLAECRARVDEIVSEKDRLEWETCDQWFSVRCARLYAQRAGMMRLAGK